MTVAGWYPDPLAPDPLAPDPLAPDPLAPGGRSIDGAPAQLRWWSGTAWTEEVHVPAPELTPALVARLTATPGEAVPETAPVDETLPGPFRTVVPEQRRHEGRHSDIWIPPTFAEQGQLPWVCVEHGDPASRMQKVKLYSRTPLWAFILVIAGVLVFAIVALAIRETVTGYWPVCSACEHKRNRLRHYLWLAVGSIAVFLGLGIALASGALIILALVAVVAAIVLWDRSEWRHATRADVVRGSRVVHVRTPAPAFVAALPALPNRAPGRGAPGVRPQGGPGVVVRW